MTTMISTLKEVREALHKARRQITHADVATHQCIAEAIDQLDALIAAQEKAKPVAWMRIFADCRSVSFSPDNAGFPARCDALKVEPLYTAPQTAPSTSPLTWLPIETAPKDGTVFLGLHGNKVREAYRVQRDDCEMWCFGGSSGDVEIAPYTKPTHWMPLPDAPAHGIGAKP